MLECEWSSTGEVRLQYPINKVRKMNINEIIIKKKIIKCQIRNGSEMKETKKLGDFTF